MAIESLFALLKNLFIYSSYVSEKSSFPMPLSKEKEKFYLDKAESETKRQKTYSSSIICVLLLTLQRNMPTTVTTMS